jgi:hypothetical protein
MRPSSSYSSLWCSCWCPSVCSPIHEWRPSSSCVFSGALWCPCLCSGIPSVCSGAPACPCAFPLVLLRALIGIIRKTIKAGCLSVPVPAGRRSVGVMGDNRHANKYVYGLTDFSYKSKSIPLGTIKYPHRCIYVKRYHQVPPIGAYTGKGTPVVISTPIRL